MNSLLLPWETLMGCFRGRGTDPREFYKSTFDDDLLRARVRELFGARAPDVPAAWYSCGYADEVACEGYARVIVGYLAGRGVTVTGVPPLDPFEEKWGRRQPSERSS